VNPQEYDGVVASWIQGTNFERRDTYHLIARSAFGDLYLCVIHDFEITSDEMDRELQNFLLSTEVEYNDFDDLFKPTKKKLGTLRHDEMYGFVPALMLGGEANLDHLEKLKAVEHLIFALTAG
jgi:hypothetical protein